MGFLRKLFGGSDSDKQEAVVQAQEKLPELNEQPGYSNQAAISATGVQEDEEQQAGWLSRAWSGMKDMGAAMKGGAKGGALNGALVGAMPAVKAGELGGDLGGKKGAAAGAATGGILALPGMLIGGLIGGIVGAGKGIYDHLDSDDQELVKETADIPTAHVIYEQLAHVYAYGKGDTATLDLWGYEMSSEFEDKNSGFRVIGVKPKSKDAKDPEGNPLEPVVAFRGTANKGGALDDINDQGVGTFQFSRNEKEVKNTITSTQGKPTVTGHSLGGALAQLCAARLGGMVGDIVTFQAAGINGDDAQKIDKDEHKATHYRTAGDLVHSGGEAFALGEVIQFSQKGTDSALSHMTFPLAKLNALRGKTDSDVPKVEGVRKSGGDEWVVDKEGDYHDGHWATAEASAESNLHEVERFDDANQTEQSFVVNAMGGRGFAGKFMDGIASLGVADRQQDFAKAWKEIRAIAMTVNSDKDVPSVRKRVVDVVLRYEIPAMDHAKFISQAEAAMIDALEAKVAMATSPSGPAAPGMA